MPPRPAGAPEEGPRSGPKHVGISDKLHNKSSTNNKLETTYKNSKMDTTLFASNCCLCGSLSIVDEAWRLTPPHYSNTASASQIEKSYRGYRYNKQTDAFYKFHTEYVSYERAKLVCEAEGAQLMVPTPKDITQAHGMMKEFPDLANFAWVGDDGLEHEVEESEQNEFEAKFNFLPSLCEVVTRDGIIEKESCRKTFPFICKLPAKSIYHDDLCKVYAKGYQYIESVGSCYKISSIAYSWDQAYDACRAEESHLVILNSELEHQVVHNLTHYAPKVSSDAQSPWYWYAGVRAQRPKIGEATVYKTIFGQTLAEAGYDQWSVGEPNNLYGNELCGSIFTNDGKYNDLDCTHLFAFICEKEIGNPRTH